MNHPPSEEMYDLGITRSRSVKTWTISSRIPCLFALSTCKNKTKVFFIGFPASSVIFFLLIQTQKSNWARIEPLKPTIYFPGVYRLLGLLHGFYSTRFRYTQKVRFQMGKPSCSCIKRHLRLLPKASFYLSHWCYFYWLLIRWDKNIYMLTYILNSTIYQTLKKSWILGNFLCQIANIKKPL